MEAAREKHLFFGAAWPSYILLKKEDVKHLEDPSIVDAALMRLARNVTLPLGNAVSFKYIIDRRVDLDVKMIYTVAGGACKPSIALAEISRDNSEYAIASDLEKTKIMPSLNNLRLTAGFIAKAAIYIIKCLACVMLGTVATRHSRPIPQTRLVQDPLRRRVPFWGQNQYSNHKGDSAGFIPQDRRLLLPKESSHGRPARTRGRKARFYRLGRQFHMPSNTPLGSKQKKAAAPVGREPQKSF